MTDREKAIVMAHTGYTMLAGDKLGIFYKYVQEKLGRSVMTHELAYQEVQDAIKEASKEDFIAIAKADNGWISVEDRLPECFGEEYIVYITSNDGEKCVTCDHLVRSSRKHWFLFDDANAVVTHWMPLPKPPEEVSGDD